ncbi:putative nuclease HARBI1 [Haliotis asinina]|uniref:putative nuclease HARBI1 n=1 Tax=Haliotis asinina TaxID=109174 RepID=UPI003531AF3A
MASARLLLQELFDDTSSDDSSDESDDEFQSILTLLAGSYDRPRVENYVQGVVPLYSLDTFKTFFRMSRKTFEELLQIMTTCPGVQMRNPSAGRPQIPIETDLLMHLWYMGSQECVRSMADRFDVSESTFVVHNRAMLDVLVNHVMPKIIRWPDHTEYDTVAEAFARKKGFPGVIGALDGTHIRIKAPHDHETDYINRKRYHSIILQAVCCEDMRYTDVYTGWPGRVHDARVLRNSPLWETGPRLCRQHLVLADGAYPCRRWLLTPFRDNGNLNRLQTKFNKCLSGTRVTIENSFGILKGRFRRLQFVDMADINYICKAIMSACVLHNICAIGGDELAEVFEDDVPPADNRNPNLQENDAEGPLRRMQLMHHLANVWTIYFFHKML